MTKKNLVILLVIGIVVIAGVIITLSKRQSEESSKNSNNNSLNNNFGNNLIDDTTGLIPKNTDFNEKNSNTDTSNEPQPSPFSQVTNTLEPNIITYSLFGYSPSTLEITKGTTVTFKNSAETSMWTASGIHPTHREYPTMGGCIGSAFDACKGVAKGESWSFTFDKVGTWKYHDHLLPSRTGTIMVK